MRNAFLALLGIFGWWYLWHEPAVHPYPLTNPLRAPIQTEPENESPWRKEEGVITPLADYQVTARVLGVERYRFDAGAEFSPYDFALGWGEMSEYRIAEQLRIRQSFRWYSYSWDSDGPPIPETAIVRNSSNHHLVPATAMVRDALAKVQPGDVVHLTGKLIRIEKADGWNWQSSLSRDDSGGGSCELMWVDAVERRSVH